MLEAKQLTKQYGEHLALDSLDLQIGPGEVYCLVGANGAGKTTTISLFLNFISPTSGAALVNDICIAEQPDLAKRHLAYIPETVSLYGQLSGVENLDYFSTLAGYRLTGNEKLELLERAGLRREDARRRASQYSKGMRQKVGIAIALAKNATATNLSECSHFTWRQNLIFLNRQMIHKVPQGSADVLPQGQIIGNYKILQLIDHRILRS